MVIAGMLLATGVSVLRAQESNDTRSLDTASASLGGSGVESPVQACRVRHSIVSRSLGRFSAVLTISNTGRTQLTGWTLRWTYPGIDPAAIPDLSAGWNSAVSADAIGGQAIDGETSRVIPAGGSATIAFTGVVAGEVPEPSGFTLNGVRCR